MNFITIPAQNRSTAFSYQERAANLTHGTVPKTWTRPFKLLIVLGISLLVLLIGAFVGPLLGPKHFDVSLPPSEYISVGPCYAADHMISTDETTCW